jgi:hypothetical protein
MATPDRSRLAAVRIPGGHAARRHRGTRHAGPCSAAPEAELLTLDLSGSNATDRHAVALAASALPTP